MKLKRGERSRRGLTLIEMLLVVSILGLLARALVETSTSMSRVTSTGNVQARLQEHGERGLRAIVQDMRRSGFQVFGTKPFPYWFDGGDAGEGDFGDHSHPPAQQEGEDGDEDFGPSREIVFVLPADDDADGVPDFDANGIIWSLDEYSYVIVTGPDGENYLERRINGVTNRRVTSHVERVVFDVADSPSALGSDLTLPTGAVRVRLYLRMQGTAGETYKWQGEVTMTLRNGLPSELGI